MQLDFPDDDDELLQRAIENDTSALVMLLSRHRPKLESRIRSRVALNPSIDFTAEDVLQETYIDVFNGITTFQPERCVSFSTWLFRVADNRLSKMIRDRSRLKRGGGRWSVDLEGSSIVKLLADLGDDAITGSERLAKEEVSQALSLAVASLPDQQREAINRYYVAQQDLAKISEEMGTTKDAVRGLLHRAKKALEQLMGGSSRWFHRR